MAEHESRVPDLGESISITMWAGLVLVERLSLSGGLGDCILVSLQELLSDSWIEWFEVHVLRLGHALR